MSERAMVILNIIPWKKMYDIDIPLDINASELLEGLSSAYNLGIDTEDVTKCYIKCENPIVLMHGKKTLAEYGIRCGSIINITDVLS